MKKKEKQVLLLRILLGILIVCNMVMIFLFSSQNGKKSAAVSQKVTINMVGMIPKDYLEKITEAPEDIGTTGTVPSAKPNSTKPIETTPEEPAPEETTPEESKPEETTPEETTPEETTPEESKPEETTPEETTPEESTPEKPKDPKDELTKEQLALVRKWHTPIRKLAHMLEFGSLATLAFLLLLTWPGKILWRYAASLGFAFVYAATDELHQLFQDGRGARFEDVAIDFAGAFVACTLLLIIVLLVRRKRRLVTTNGDQPAKKQSGNLLARIRSLVPIKKKKNETDSEKTTEEKSLSDK